MCYITALEFLQKDSSNIYKWKDLDYVPRAVEDFV